MKMNTLRFNDKTFDINDDGALRYDEDQGLSDDEMAQARKNAGAAAVGEGGAGGTLSAEVIDNVLVVALPSGVMANIENDVLVVA